MYITFPLGVYDSVHYATHVAIATIRLYLTAIISSLCCSEASINNVKNNVNVIGLYTFKLVTVR